MSSRVLKKLNLVTNEPLPAFDNNDDNTEESDNASDREEIRNSFDLLEDNSESENEKEELDADLPAPIPCSSQSVNPIKKRKKAKMKKRLLKAKAAQSKDEEIPIESKIKACDTDGDQKKDTSVNDEPSSPSADNLDMSLLCVKLKNFSPQNEIRRTFGKDVAKFVTTKDRSKITLKSMRLIAYRETWPPIMNNCISMVPQEPPSSSKVNSQGELWFNFVYSDFYRNIQHIFLYDINQNDPNMLLNLIEQCPYHIDSLIQLSELCRTNEDYGMSCELIERALYGMEASFHSSFNLSSGNCRIDYNCRENRAFFILLFRYAQNLETRGFCRTALEIAKFLLSLNLHADPLSVILIIDFYALRSKEFNWLIEFYEKFDSVRNLSQLPNMAYSYALALYFLKEECEEADKAIQFALLMFPGALRSLLQNLSIKLERVDANPYFNTDAANSQLSVLQQLIFLYVKRTASIWLQRKPHNWLKRNVNIVLDMIESNTEITNVYSSGMSICSRYMAMPRPVLRHVFLSDFIHKYPEVFMNNQQQSTVERIFDPFPPVDPIKCDDQHLNSQNMTTSHRVANFFRLIMSSFAINNSHSMNQNQNA